MTIYNSTLPFSIFTFTSTYRSSFTTLVLQNFQTTMVGLSTLFFNFGFGAEENTSFINWEPDSLPSSL